MNITVVRLNPLVKEVRRLNSLIEKWLIHEGVINLGGPDVIVDEVTYVDPERQGILEWKQSLGIITHKETDELANALSGEEE